MSRDRGQPLRSLTIPFVLILTRKKCRQGYRRGIYKNICCQPTSSRGKVHRSIFAPLHTIAHKQFTPSKYVYLHPDVQTLKTPRSLNLDEQPHRHSLSKKNNLSTQPRCSLEAYPHVLDVPEICDEPIIPLNQLRERSFPFRIFVIPNAFISSPTPQT